MGKASKRQKNIAGRVTTGNTQLARHKMAGGTQVQTGAVLPKEESITRVLGALLKMEVSDESPLEEVRSELKMIVIAWNISLHDTEKQASLIQTLIDELSMDDILKQKFVNAVKKYIFKKQLFFPDDKRFVVSHELQSDQSGMYISAVAYKLSADHDLPMPYPVEQVLPPQDPI